MKVLTLYNSDFNVICAKLEALAADYNPDLVVTIASGGDYVGANIFGTVTHVSVRCGRRGTPAKKKSVLLNRFVKHLPRRVNDVLRMVEARILSLRKPKLVDISLSEDVKRKLVAAERVLVVDDAVDSGATLIAVLDAVYKAAGSSKVRSAAITVTTEKPMVMPDYFLYHDETLIRFPWSIDAN
jgi:hypoxanthine phosphoribosyltransferase